MKRDGVLGVSMRVKVTAETEEDADLAAQMLFIDDWEEAGPLRIGDLTIEMLGEDEVKMLGGIDRSIIATGGARYETAPDDPSYEPEEEDAPAVSAG